MTPSTTWSVRASEPDSPVRKNEAELRDALSKAILDIRADGTYKKLNGKYFPIDIYGK